MVICRGDLGIDCCWRVVFWDPWSVRGQTSTSQGRQWSRSIWQVEDTGQPGRICEGIASIVVIDINLPKRATCISCSMDEPLCQWRFWCVLRCEHCSIANLLQWMVIFCNDTVGIARSCDKKACSCRSAKPEGQHAYHTIATVLSVISTTVGVILTSSSWSKTVGTKIEIKETKCIKCINV